VAKSAQRKWAILIGANEYHDSAINSLKFCANDTKSLREVLVQPERGGYEETGTLLLTDGSGRDFLPTRSNIMSRVSSVAKMAEREDSILFAFSGHGMEENGLSYLLPADARTGVLAETAIGVKWIKDTLGQASVRAKIMILDACHAGAMKGKDDTGRMTEKFSSEILDLAEGFAMLSSCKLNESSYEWEEKQHGVFSYFLCEGLMGYADADGDGIVTVSEASSYVTKKVKEWAFRKNVQQSPNLEYRVSGDIALSYVPGSFKAISQASQVGTEETYVSSMALFHKGHESEGFYDAHENAKALCAKLLRFYKADEITAKEEGVYEFPDGTISYHVGDAYAGDLRLEIRYDVSRKKEIDTLVRTLYPGLEWSSLDYVLTKKFDTDKLIALCNRHGITIRSYDPREVSPIVVSAPGWGAWGQPARVSFFNSSEGAVVSIVQLYRSREVLEDAFYDKLNPKTIVEFISPALV
jgi:hypothetical protein